MTEPYPITIPLLNPNEPGALLAALHVIPGQPISPGDRLCTLEATKSTDELTAEFGGYVVGLAVEPGRTVQAGDVLSYLADSPDWIPPLPQKATGEVGVPPREGLRISQPALHLAQQHSLDLTKLSGDVFINKNMAQELIDLSTRPKLVLQPHAYDPNAIIIYGGGGHGKALIDLIRVLGIYSIAGIVDDDPPDSSIMGVPVLGGSNILEELIEQGVYVEANAVGGIGNLQSRIKGFERVAKAGFTCPVLVHPSAFVEQSAILAEGVQVMPHADVGSDSRPGVGVTDTPRALV